ncbi:4-hydroxyphenylacetate decarboxylase small subunit [Thermanaeromonas toyohensis ToBE]|uniref:4-hydroxyphenylacetate decarboxylase small subunit n=1 Tax=Thermanaeromonas toyohensis ToBE TaxID=698762 RepID=A0A1W1VZ62_9FIRM|nr:4-hydroxyphenylacetate decarboxylase small subunit [Thermanaeromonas toyohensis]SMB98638.1 4-hydroxyphenylacetate decarboxylase small subunit [Thermanaeromonas toyohensis ToBE]
MTNIDLKHNDCRNFIPVDVAKGICRRTEQLIVIDSPVCPNFTALPKCKNCSHFSASETEEFIGTCEAEKSKPWTYSELIAVTCEMYNAAK